MSDDRPTSPGDARDSRLFHLGGLARYVHTRVRSPRWLARAAGYGLCLASIGFVAALAVALVRHGEVGLVTRPPLVRVALFVPAVVTVLAFGTAVGAVVGWWNRYWTPTTRLHQTVLAVLGLAFVWQLAALGFLALP